LESGWKSKLAGKNFASALFSLQVTKFLKNTNRFEILDYFMTILLNRFFSSGKTEYLLGLMANIST